MTDDVAIRNVIAEDLPFLFEHQLDPVANHMAAFTHKDPSDRDAFNAHWAKLRADEKVIVKTILFEGRVAGSVARFEWLGRPEVCYWLGREFWGMGIATETLSSSGISSLFNNVLMPFHDT